MSRRDFLSMPAPENYVAGLGRGATGFTTRSDLGPAREGPSEEQMKEMLAKRAASLGQAAPSAYGVTEKKEEERDEEEDRFQDPDNEVGLFSSGMNYDKEDDEADRIYQEVDEKMDKRRRARREAREQQERDEYERNNPKIQLQFADLKRALGGVSEEEWAALPEVGDMTGKAKRAREARMANSRSYAVPDSVLAAASKSGELDTSISSDADGMTTNLASIGAAQLSALTVRLDSAASAPGSQTTTTSGTTTSVDPKGYMTALSRKEAMGGEVPVEDINRARVLLESAVKTNIHNGPGYVALARLEEVAGKIHTAKKVIARGCELCPKSIVVWEEAIRLNRDNLHNAKIIAANGIKQNPKAVKLWEAAIDLEQTQAARKKVTRQALDHNPQSVELWKTLINDTEELDAVRLLFAKATETIPLAEELWVSYARVSEPEAAQQILNKARKAIPTSWAIWIHACRLQEELGKVDMLDMIMSRAVKSLIKENAMIKREEWIAQAEICEEQGDKGTAAAIIKATVGWGLDEDDDRRDVWLEDARSVLNRNKPETARAILGFAVAVFPYSTTVWHASTDLEKHHGTTDTLLNVLERAVNACPNSESLWLLYAREMWQSGNPEGARKVLGRSFEALPGNEMLYTRAVDFEVDAGNFDEARQFLKVARESAATDRIFMKSAVLERQLENYETAIDICNQGLQNWPGSWKLHAVKGQVYEQLSKLPEAHEAFSIGTRAVPKAPVLYILLSRLQVKQGAVVKARSTLDRGRQQNPTSEDILLEQVRLERRQNNMNAAQQLMAGALQKCPNSGKLWAEKIMHLENRTQRKPRALEAIKKVEKDAQLFVVVARIFWSERRLDKAATWFVKAVTLDSDYGDAWVWYYKFLEQHGTEEKKQDTLSKVALAEPKHGEIWQSVAKDPKNARLGVEEVLKLAAQNAE
ncbi:TadD Flp pilus assembly protein TadD contains TPR repeats [Pyrenophora tritici-repentis]|uniref:Pre-mRNA-splicing factor prp1 n=2 Tax=Pyrenophora tritici-repentis TaxID=45151 RepID=A0A2W1FMM5_9PLEO|nr:pre-mRNA-splicing factor prp1 [Pyrenophora tritici-repentis Pt-1C-BFP]KAA8627029.1 Pre-mRNA-splicing factor prp1 [Pyrenophora tritici-repentis]EDU41735.1 pre-mRNA-splicing factor prp1 [Pyrenophora tritici-repentis Pt-1C-BFP]KAF7455471.1 Pre-mRNA-splicing factor prp1 [Pyrenophora tritici-repentis]KAF7578656.1 TadD, Flp pilus assembly protein TadD [Pyrenophora tritici-repentis]KAG9389213.1 Pre-mRNA-splicing factor prp1 [Pyrenophora tritici-repentis]